MKGGYAAPEPLRDAKGGRMHAGRFWNYDSKKHESEDLRGAPAIGRAYSATPWDVDGDGDLDLIVGADSGKLLVRINTGTAQEPTFSPDVRTFDGPGGAVGFPAGYAMPVVADWDGDGVWDLVSGGKDGSVSWLRNSGTATAPSFEAARVLVDAATAARYGIKTRTQIDVVDFDGDGLLDLLIGDHSSVADGDTRTYSGRVRFLRRRAAADGEAAEASAPVPPEK